VDGLRETPVTETIFGVSGGVLGVSGVPGVVVVPPSPDVLCAPPPPGLVGLGQAANAKIAAKINETKPIFFKKTPFSSFNNPFQAYNTQAKFL
jgi:hypothetical protein